MTSCVFCSVEGTEGEGPLGDVSIPIFRGDDDGVEPPSLHGEGEGGAISFVFSYVCKALMKRVVNFDLKGKGSVPVRSGLIKLPACGQCCKAFKEIEEHFQKISSILKDLNAARESIIKGRTIIAPNGSSSARVLSPKGQLCVEEGVKITPNLFPEEEHMDIDPLNSDTPSSVLVKEEPLDLDFSPGGPMGMELAPDKVEEDIEIVPTNLFRGNPLSLQDDIKDEPFDDEEIEEFTVPSSRKKSVPKSSSRLSVKHKPSKKTPTSEVKLFCRFCPYVNKRQISVRTHEKRNHAEELKHKCPGCNENFSSKEIAEEHSRLHQKLLYPQNCGICGKENIINILLHERHIFHCHVPRDDDGSIPSKRHSCRTCKIYFRTASETKSHYRQQHRKKEQVVCDIPGCGKKFGSGQALLPHLLHFSHPQGEGGEEQLVLPCTVCGKCFHSNFLLKRHEGLHKKYDGTGRTLLCPHCDLPFFPQEEGKLKRHVASLHKRVEAGNNCSVPCCGASFSSRCSLKHHETTKHPELLIHVCSQKGCDAAYSELCFLETHLRTHKPPEDKGYICMVTDCNFTFPTPEGLGAHLASHNGEGVKGKLRPCPDCEKTFNSDSALRYHRVAQHGFEGCPSFPCTSCPLRFPLQSELEIHRGIKHPEEIEAEIKFPCPVCQKLFYPAKRLKVHMKCHRPPEEMKNKKTFACEYCGKIVGNIKRHVEREHQGEEGKKKTCYFCGKRIHSKFDLDVHLRTHTKERPFICPNFKSCGKDFTQTHVLKSHLKRCGK